MTSPESSVQRAAPWYVRPPVILPLVAAFLIIGALLAPERDQGGDPRPTTFSTRPRGAQLLFDLAQRLGWQSERRLVAAPPEGETIIHAVLAPNMRLRRVEAHELLERVRAGASLFVVLSDGDPIGDSLRVFASTSGDVPVADTAATPCPPFPRNLMAGYWAGGRARLTSLRWRGATPEGMTTFLSVWTDTGTTRIRAPRPAFVGFPLGRGRIAVAADPDLVRNDALRMCTNGLDVPLVRGLEYLRDGGDEPRTRIVFDEFHHGFGEQPGATSTIASYLGVTPSGHAFAQLLLAGLLLLIAVAPRLIQPRDPERIERRSPLEHIDALARAYAQVGASRTATARLVRGLRRRRERGAVRANREVNDDAFLTRVEHAAPALAGDIASIRRALSNRVSKRDLEAIGVALHNVETFLSRT